MVKDEYREEKETPADAAAGAAAPGSAAAPAARADAEELSEEDQHLKDELEMLVERLGEPEHDAPFYDKCMATLKEFIRDSTTSMTAVPKPLKFLRPHLPALTEVYQLWAAGTPALAVKLADILLVLAMTYSDDGKKESLKYRLLAGDDSEVADWGHEYMRHLALEIGDTYQEQLGSDDGTIALLVSLSLKIAPFFLRHNAEADAVDLLLEVECIDRLPEFVDDNTYARVCLYMVSCVPLLAPPDDSSFLHTAYLIYLAHAKLTQALVLAMKLDDQLLIRQVFGSTTDALVHQQLAFILLQQLPGFKLSDDDDEAAALLQSCIANTKLHDYYAYLVKELNLLDPKVPEDIYKLHLENAKFGLGTLGLIDLAKQNLAAAFVNAFVNLGYGSDKLVQTEEDNKLWIYKTKGNGMISTTALLGSIHQWDINEGLQALDKYTYSSEDEVKAGALLGTGLVLANVHDEVDAALALLQEYVNDPKKVLQTSAINGLGIAFAGSSNDEVLQLLLPLVSDLDVPIEVSSLAALALGHVFVGTCHGDITSTILQTLLERPFTQLTNKFVRFLSLGLGLLYMGKTEQVEDVLETIDAIEHSTSKTLKVLVNICAYAGTGNVLQIQSLLQMCTAKPKDSDEDKKLGESEEDQKAAEGAEGAEGAESAEGAEGAEAAEAAEGAEGAESTAEGAGDNAGADGGDDTADTEMKDAKDAPEKEDDSEDEEELYQGFAVLGLACIAMGEEIGQDMSLRNFLHLMHYGNPLIRRAVPLAMGLVSTSNPQMKVFDILSRHSHDPDLEVAQNSIYAMGLVGAGTNNARLAQLLRQLASYYIKLSDLLFMVRIAQGLLHLGKGTLLLNPFNSERTILSKVSLASLLTISVALLDPKLFVLSDSSTETTHQLLYYISPAIKPRMLVTVDEHLNPIKVNVRVGQAVDVVGQAGKPKTITGWVTQLTPVLLNYGERAELESVDEWISLTNLLEGVVILKKNPEFMEVDA